MAAPTIPHRRPVHLLGKRATRTAGFGTPEPSILQPDPHRLAGDRSVDQTAFIATVHSLRVHPAVRTGRAHRARPTRHLGAPATRGILSITTAARCGINTSRQSRSHARHDHADHRRSRAFGCWVIAYASENQLGLIRPDGNVVALRPFRAWRVVVTGFLTNSTGDDLAALELWHRRHACFEDRIRAAKHTGLRNLRLHDAAANQVCWRSMLAADLIAHTQRLALSGALRVAEPKRLRLTIFGVAGRVVRTARRRILRIPTAWRPWARGEVLFVVMSGRFALGRSSVA